MGNCYTPSFHFNTNCRNFFIRHGLQLRNNITNQLKQLRYLRYLKKRPYSLPNELSLCVKVTCPIMTLSLTVLIYMPNRIILLSNHISYLEYTFSSMDLLVSITTNSSMVWDFSIKLCAFMCKIIVHFRNISPEILIRKKFGIIHEVIA